MDVTQERGRLYGKFSDNANTTQLCESIFKELPGYADAPNVHKEALHMILQKLSRCFSGGSYEYDDHWVDIQGYSSRVVDYINNTEDY